jgi:hypothetical protein
MRITANFTLALATVALGLALSGTARAAAPTITFAQVWAGSQINIGGTNFGTTAGSVTVNGSPVTVASWSDTQIFVSSPLRWPLTAQVVVTTPAALRAVGYIFNPVSVLSSVAYDRDSQEMVTAVSLNGHGNQIHVSPGAPVTLDLDYSACVGCALQFGFNTGAPQACFLAPIAVWHATQLLTAPATPGIYYVLFDRNDTACRAGWDLGTPPQTQAIGAVSVY